MKAVWTWMIALALLGAGACGDDTEASGNTPEAGASGGDGDGDADGDPGAPDAGSDGALYAIMYEVFDDVGSTSYLSLVESLDIEAIDVDQAREYAGGRAYVASYDGAVFVGSAESPTVTRYTANEDGTLEEGNTISLASYGFTSGLIDPWSINFISASKAYIFDYVEGTTIVFDPTAMEITGEILAPDELHREGFSIDASPGIVRGSRLMRSISWANWDGPLFAEDQLLAIFDTDADELVELVPESRCPSSSNLVHEDEAGNFYFSNWIWPVAATLLHDEPERCVLRVNAGEERFDPEWSLQYADFADGRQGANFSYTGDGRALVAIFYDEETTYDETTDGFELVGQPIWRIWGIDADTGEGEPIEGLEPNAGAFTPLRFDDRRFVMVPGANWERTAVYEVEDGRAEHRFDIPGWSYQVVKVR